MVQLSIIIVSWNVKGLLNDCLKSIYGTLSNITFEIIVVDNNSADGGVETAAGRFPKIKLVRNKTNLGFPAANNQAIREAGGKFILLLNPDTICYPETIEGVLKFMEQSPGCGIATCLQVDSANIPLRYQLKMRNYEVLTFGLADMLKQEIFNGLRMLYRKNKALINMELDIVSSGCDFALLYEKDPVEINSAVGSFMMIRKTVLERIGLFDETLFFNYDDEEFCHRARIAGWRIFFCPQYKITHLINRSIQQWEDKHKQDVTAYSHLMFYKKYRGKALLSLSVMGIILCNLTISLIRLAFAPFLAINRVKPKNRNSQKFLYPSLPYAKNLFKVILNQSYYPKHR